jgi:hypothetical protein
MVQYVYKVGSFLCCSVNLFIAKAEEKRSKIIKEKNIRRFIPFFAFEFQVIPINFPSKIIPARDCWL